jgi:hypothetical protein
MNSDFYKAVNDWEALLMELKNSEKPSKRNWYVQEVKRWILDFRQFKNDRLAEMQKIDENISYFTGYKRDLEQKLKQ